MTEAEKIIIATCFGSKLTLEMKRVDFEASSSRPILGKLTVEVSSSCNMSQVLLNEDDLETLVERLTDLKTSVRRRNYILKKQTEEPYDGED